jgi:hypothetical protein
MWFQKIRCSSCTTLSCSVPAFLISHIILHRFCHFKICFFGDIILAVKLCRIAQDFQWPETILLKLNFWFRKAGFPDRAVHDPVCDADSFSASLA